MCPFSHGSFVFFVICLCTQPLTVSCVSERQDDDEVARESRTLASGTALQVLFDVAVKCEVYSSDTERGLHLKVRREHAVSHPSSTANEGRNHQGQQRDAGQVNSQGWNHPYPSFSHRKSKQSNKAKGSLPIHRLTYLPSVRRQGVFQVPPVAHTQNIPVGIIHESVQSQKILGTAFDSSNKPHRTGFPAQHYKKKQSINDKKIDESGYKNESLVRMVLLVHAESHVRSKRSPSKSQLQKKESSTVPVAHISSAERNATLSHLSDTEKHVSHGIIKNRLSSKKEAETRRRLKAKMASKKLQQEGDARTGGGTESSNKPDNHPTSSPGVVSTLATSKFQAALSEGIQKLDTKRQSHSSVSSTEHKVTTKKQGKATPTPYIGLDGTPLNLTAFIKFLKEKDFQRQLNREAQWAYMCLVAVICLMLWCLWYLGGFARCRYQPDSSVSFTESQHMMTVEEVLMRKQQYLPMFNEPEWEDVPFCNRGTDP